MKYERRNAHKNNFSIANKFVIHRGRNNNLKCCPWLVQFTNILIKLH